MIYGKMYPAKSITPINVKVEQHKTRHVKGVFCVDPNRMPFHYWPAPGEWVPTKYGNVDKSNLFDLRSTRIISEGNSIHEHMIAGIPAEAVNG